MNKISAVIVAHNEEKKIHDCLASLDFVDEIVVVLDKCNDKTKEIVLKFTPKIIEGVWNIEGSRRNIALQNASNEWILELDADERISPKLKEEILDAINNEQNRDLSGFIIPIVNYVGNRRVENGWLRTICPSDRLCLSKSKAKVFDEDNQVHPTYKFNGKYGFLKNSILHFVDDDIADLIARFNRYTNWRANDIIAKQKKIPSLFSLSISAMWRFDKSYFFKKGYKEGLLGVLIAALCALYPIVSCIKAKEKLNENR